MAYLNTNFINNIDKNSVKLIFELGSRDLTDSIRLLNYYHNSKIYAFECNPDCLEECQKNYSKLENDLKKRLTLIENAICIEDGLTSFYPFDLTKYNNKGASSMLKIDFSRRSADDPDYNRENPQKEIKVNGTRLDTFIEKNNLKNIDMLCIDLQGYELKALKSMGEYLKNVKYIITECSITNTYVGGAHFKDLNEYLISYNFTCVEPKSFSHLSQSQEFQYHQRMGLSEFDALFINKSL